jgi:HopA1 effector protein family
MQLSNSKDLLDTPADRVLKVLEDVVIEIQILPDFQFSQPHHAPLALEPEICNSLQQLPTQRQDQYLRWRLGSYLLSLYEAEGTPVKLEPKSEAVSLPIQDEPVQNTALGVHSSFYGRLHTQNIGKGYFDPGWQVLRQESDGLFAVRKNGLTLHIGDRHLQAPDRQLAIGDEVAIRIPSNRIEQGCYVALSNVGPVDPDREPVANIYFNLQPDDLVFLMGALTTPLNALHRPFTLKVPYDSEDCDRPDSGVLSIHKTDWAAVYSILQLLYPSLQRLLRPEVPLFTKRLAPGLALAEQPIDTITLQENFGMHRFQAIAQGLIQAWRQNEDTAAARMSCVLQSLAEHQVDIYSPYLNPGSEDVYTTLVTREAV